MDKQYYLELFTSWPDNNQEHNTLHKIADTEWSWSMKFNGEWELERYSGFKPEDLITRRDFDIKKDGLDKVLLKEANARIKVLEKQLNEEVPRGREMGT